MWNGLWSRLVTGSPTAQALIVLDHAVRLYDRIDTPAAERALTTLLADGSDHDLSTLADIAGTVVRVPHASSDAP